MAAHGHLVQGLLLLIVATVLARQTTQQSTDSPSPVDGSLQGLTAVKPPLQSRYSGQMRRNGSSNITDTPQQALDQDSGLGEMFAELSRMFGPGVAARGGPMSGGGGLPGGNRSIMGAPPSGGGMGQFMNMFRAMGQQPGSQPRSFGPQQSHGEQSMWNSGSQAGTGFGQSNPDGMMNMLRGLNPQQRGPQQGFGGQGMAMSQMMPTLLGQGRAGNGNMFGRTGGPPNNMLGGPGMFGSSGMQRNQPGGGFGLGTMFANPNTRTQLSPQTRGNPWDQQRNVGSHPVHSMGPIGSPRQSHYMGQTNMGWGSRPMVNTIPNGLPNGMPNGFPGFGQNNRAPPHGVGAMMGAPGAPDLGQGGLNPSMLNGIIQGFMSRMGAPNMRPGPPPKPKPTFCKEYDCPPYTVLRTGQNYELRRYSPMTFAAADIPDEKYSKIMVYWTIAQYILQGENQEGLKMPITVPILTKNDSSSSPVHRTMYFLLPYLRQTRPPRPTHPWIRIVQLPAMDVYVRSAMGYLTDAQFGAQATALRADLGPSNPTLPNVTFTAGYDTMFRFRSRYNEIWLVSRFQGEEQMLMSVTKNYTKPVTKGAIIHNIFLTDDGGLPSSPANARAVGRNINQANKKSPQNRQPSGLDVRKHNPSRQESSVNNSPSFHREPPKQSYPQGANRQMPSPNRPRDRFSRPRPARPDQRAVDVKTSENINFVQNSNNRTNVRNPSQPNGTPPSPERGRYPGFVPRPGFNIF